MLGFGSTFNKTIRNKNEAKRMRPYTKMVRPTQPVSEGGIGTVITIACCMCLFIGTLYAFMLWDSKTEDMKAYNIANCRVYGFEPPYCDKVGGTK